jgi:hypothetical protein
LVRKLHKDARYISWRISHDQLSAARDEFVRRYTEASCQPWTSVVRVAKRLFNAQCREFKNAWTVVSQLAKLMFHSIPGHGRRLKEPPAHAWLLQSLDGDKDSSVQGCLEVFGVLLCWNTDFGLREPALISMVQSGLQGDALLQCMLHIPIYKWHFDAFRDRLQYLASVWNLR